MTTRCRSSSSLPHAPPSLLTAPSPRTRPRSRRSAPPSRHVGGERKSGSSLSGRSPGDDSGCACHRLPLSPAASGPSEGFQPREQVLVALPRRHPLRPGRVPLRAQVLNALRHRGEDEKTPAPIGVGAHWCSTPRHDRDHSHASIAPPLGSGGERPGRTRARRIAAAALAFTGAAARKRRRGVRYGRRHPANDLASMGPPLGSGGERPPSVHVISRSWKAGCERWGLGGHGLARDGGGRARFRGWLVWISTTWASASGDRENGRARALAGNGQRQAGFWLVRKRRGRARRGAPRPRWRGARGACRRGRGRR